VLYQAQENVHHTETDEIDVRTQQPIYHTRQNQLFFQYTLDYWTPNKGFHGCDYDYESVLYWSPSSNRFEERGSPTALLDTVEVSTRRISRCNESQNQSRRQSGLSSVGGNTGRKDLLQTSNGQDPDIFLGCLVCVSGCLGCLQLMIFDGVDGCDGCAAHSSSPSHLNILFFTRLDSRLKGSQNGRVLQGHVFQNGQNYKIELFCGIGG
jgi:hypothetical protein